MLRWLPILLAVSVARAAPPASLRELSGNVGLIDRGQDTLPSYLDRLEAALWLEEARGTTSPYVVSIANSLEALTPTERGQRGERMLLRAYLLLAGLSGPQGGRLMHLYAMGLGQLVGASPEEVAVPEALRHDLRQIGAYASAAAGRSIRRLPPAEQAEMNTLLLLAQGRYAAAEVQARAWVQRSPSPLAEVHLAGARLLQGHPAPELVETERGGGPAGQVAWQLLRRAAREALVARLGRRLVLPRMPPQVRQAATAWGPPQEPPVREACRLLSDAKGVEEATVLDCLVLLLEEPSAAWARHPLLASTRAAEDPLGRRLRTLRLAAQLGQLLGLPGQRPAQQAAERAQALQEVSRLLPQMDLPAEDAAALTLLAQIGAAQQPQVPAHLHPAIDRFVATYPCSPLAVPLLVGRHGAAQRAQALAGALGQCREQGPRAAEAVRLLAVELLAIEATGAGGEAAWQALERLAQQARSVRGGGRVLLSLAHGATLRLWAQRGVEPSDADLVALQRRYEEALAALLPWDGAEARGHAALALAAILYRRYQSRPDGALLAQAQGLLRPALLLPPGDEVLLAQALDQALRRQELLLKKEAIPAPQQDLSQLPPGLPRRVLACELLQQARAAGEAAAIARYAALAGADPLPPVASVGQVRLTTSLGVDERLRVGTRGEVAVVVLPRCAPR
ncbi:MAG: hypothetical protein RMK29_17075 [Myxococcales bacterium]|nr:hypothetical protein [Myxococcota bacterium]MDW8283422.1 hypothetical protein [Myxococcales bacterium]